MQKSESALFAGSSSAALVGAAFWYLHNQNNDATLRVILMLLAILLPVIVIFIMNTRNKHSWQIWLGKLPPPFITIVSGAAGLSVWGLSWWVMFVLDEQLREAVGAYEPAFAHMRWSVDVIYSVVLIPAAVSLLIFGLMRVRLRNHFPPLLLIPLLAIYIGILNMMLTPQGIVALPGYTLLGLTAGFLCLQSDSVVPGFAAYAVFMYANRALLDNLILEFGTDAGFFETNWLTLALVSAFITLVLTQIVRFRVDAAPPISLSSLSWRGWLAIGILLAVMTVYIVSEIDRRGAANIPDVAMSVTL